VGEQGFGTTCFSPVLSMLKSHALCCTDPASWPLLSPAE